MGSIKNVRRSLTLVTAPPAEPVTTAEAKSHLRVDDSDSDTLIGTLVTAARQHIDARDGILGRALVEQTWDMKLDEFPAPGSGIMVPMPPLISVSSITYTDTNGDSQTLAASEYQVVGAGGYGRGEIVEAHSKSWPSTRDVPEAVTVRFTCGYESSASPKDYDAAVPQVIKQAMLLMVADMYENRETGVIGVSTSKIETSATVDRLLAPYRVSWF